MTASTVPGGGAADTLDSIPVLVRMPLAPAPPRTPLDELAERMHEVCASAVDSLEIAAAIEADGLSDQGVSRIYGYTNVFELADELYRRVPRQPVEPEPQPNPWHSKRITHVLHGILFGLPA